MAKWSASKCQTANGYMKADIALIKYDAFDNIVDAFIIENKLSGTTSYTKRQIEGFRAIVKNKHQTMRVMYGRENLNVNTKEKQIKADNIYRIHDHGIDNLLSVEIQRIDIAR